MHTERRRSNLKKKKEEIKCDNVIKNYKKWLILIILQKKNKRT